jgi:hypothetical protein
MPVTELEHARRTAAKRFNACVFMIAGTFNAVVLVVLLLAIVVPIVATNDAMAALTPFNGVVTGWCVVLQVFGYAMLRLAKAG